MFKKILILLIIIIATYVLIRLYSKRRIILEKQNTTQMIATSSVEHFTNSQTTDAIPQNLTLTNYFVKSSYNSCYDSTGVFNNFGRNVLKKVLLKGYRFIDMEVCYLPITDRGNSVHVCINTKYTDDSQQDNSITFPLTDAIKEIISTGLTMSDTGAKNYYEPLFIHIRVKHGNMSNINDIRTYYDEINTILFQTASGSGDDIGNYVYPLNGISGGSTNATKMANLTLSQIINSNKKCFIIIDRTNLIQESLVKNSGNKNTFNDNAIMSGFNIGEIPLYKYNDVRIQDGLYVLNNGDDKYAQTETITVNDDNTINKNTFSIAISDNKFESVNFYPYDIAKKYGVQFATMNFAINDEGMKKYETIFKPSNSSKITGFVPMSQVIKQAATDVRYDMKGDIKRGIYIGFGIVSAVGVIYGIYRYGGLANFLRSGSGGGAAVAGGGVKRSKRAI